MENLLWNTLSKFVRSKYLFNLQNGNKKVLAMELFLIYINEKMYFKSLKSLDIGLDIGTKAKSMFAMSNLLNMSEEETEFQQNCFLSYINSYDVKITFQHFSEKLLVHTPVKT